MPDTVLYLAHTGDDGSLGTTSLEALSAAKSTADALGASLVVGLVGGDVQSAADSVAACGAESILGVSGDEFAVSRYATDAAATEAIIKHALPDVVIAPQMPRFARALPGAAQRVGGRIDTHVAAIDTDGGLSIQRWYYRQRMVATLSREQRPWILLVESGVFPAFDGAPGSANVENVAVDAPTTRTKVIGTEAPDADAQTIRPEADVLFVAGAGWTKKQTDGETHVDVAEKHILGFVNGAKASLGSS